MGEETLNNYAYAESFYKGTVESITEQGEREGYGANEFYQTLRVKITEGPLKGEMVEIPYAASITTQNIRQYKEGESVVITETQLGDNTRYSVLEHYRTPELGLMTLLFVAVVLIVAGRKGLRSLVGLVVTLGVIGVWMLPQILEGKNAFWVSISSETVIAKRHGYRWR